MRHPFPDYKKDGYNILCITKDYFFYKKESGRVRRVHLNGACVVPRRLMEGNLGTLARTSSRNIGRKSRQVYAVWFSVFFRNKLVSASHNR